MVEFIALYIVCKNIGVIVRARGARAHPYQVRAVILWFVFEFACAFIAAAIGMDGILIYIAAFVGALLSLPLSFSSARAARPRRKTAERSEAR
jgi:hypothetical protein